MLLSPASPVMTSLPFKLVEDVNKLNKAEKFVGLVVMSVIESKVTALSASPAADKLFPMLSDKVILETVPPVKLPLASASILPVRL